MSDVYVAFRMFYVHRVGRLELCVCNSGLYRRGKGCISTFEHQESSVQIRLEQDRFRHFPGKDVV